jgi:sigma-B regulation protein RsbU (phosphoserine phosphatase)
MTGSANGIRALLIEDNPGDARLLREMLREAGSAQARVELSHTDRLSSGLQHLEAHHPNVVLLDLTLPDSAGMDTFARVHAADESVPIVVLSGMDDEELAVRAVHEGAQDYLVKGTVDGGTVLRSMRYAIERQRLELVRRDLERQRDEFFSSISHDLRTPVAAIKAAISVVLANEPADLSPALHRLLGNIDLAADELASLIEDLLEFARLQAGRVELWRSELDVRDVINRAARAIEPLLQVRNQRLELDMPEAPVIVSVDAERLGRVLRNLLGNAQKYGREQGQVRLSIEDATDDVCVSIADDGPGIPLEHQERIFDRFYRVSGASSAGPAGTGLGLAIARGIVDLHGGKLWVESSPGRGSTFHIRLPR